MNQKAQELGLTNTHFVTPHGLDDPDHYTTAYELAVLTDYALENDKFAQIVNSKTKVISINGQQRELYNTNELLGNLNGINGVKTGFTNQAGRCLVCSCLRDNMNIISVVLGADTKKDRTKDSIKIIEYAYENYELINLKKKIEEEFFSWERNYQTTIQKGEKQQIKIELQEIPIEYYAIKKGTEDRVKIEVMANTSFEAPVEKGKQVGTLIAKVEDEIVCELSITTSEEVKKKDTWQYFTQILTQIKENHWLPI